MALYDQIIAIYPTLTSQDFDALKGTIHLQNDSDENGDYIKSWTNSNPQPTQAQFQSTGK